MNDGRRVLIVALGFAQLPVTASALRALHAWLDSWTGIGHVIVGIERQDFKVSLRSIAVEGRAASFHGDPMTSTTGYAVAARPWTARHRSY